MRPRSPTDKARTFTETARRAQIVAAAIDTIAEVGVANASLARIGERIGISKGLVSYHFAGRDELLKQVASTIVEQIRAFMVPRTSAEAASGSGFLRAYIESNLAFMQDHRNHMMAILRASAEDQDQFEEGGEVGEAVQTLERHLARLQSERQLRPDFDPLVVALAIRAAINAILLRLAQDPGLDLDECARELVNLFHRATCLVARP